MDERTYASLESQLGNAACLCADTEEMLALRQKNTYESQVQLGNLLSGQYRFREAVEAYRLAEKAGTEDPMLYIRLGGAYLTLRYFEEAKKAYARSCMLSGNEKTAAFQMGIWNYLQGNYKEATEAFSDVLPCEDEMKIVILYWNMICSIRGKLPNPWKDMYQEEMQVGHHTAYLTAVKVFLGKLSAHAALEEARQDQDDLNAVIAMYGIAIGLEACGEKEAAEETRKLLLQRRSVWPCISYLAAWNDIKREKGS